MAEGLEGFKNPPADLRGAPFWSWNCRLDRDMLMRQIEYFHEMGMGGYTIHARTGLDTEYMGEEFLGHVRACVEKGKSLGMKTHLYDEDRWPSGYGGGEVTKDPAFRYRYIVFTPQPPNEKPTEPWVALFAHSAPDDGSRKLLARYSVTLDKDGRLEDYRLLKDGETGGTGENVWYAYMEIAGSHPGFNGQSYVDVLNPAATRRFIETTHEKYKKAVGEEFGKAVPDIFTDEPEHVLFGTLPSPFHRGGVSVPYTDDFDVKYREKYGVSVFEHLPELFWERADGEASLHRYRYHDFTAGLFAQSYSRVLGEWCGENGIALTGHLQDEDHLSNQTRSLGEAMRHYPFYQRPGIDILCNMREYATAKQAQSVANQTGREGLTSELYGVTNWDFDFRGHKLQGDWQAALGVVHRVHHLAYASMAGESKRDYPASIFYQSPWYKKYGYIEDYFARVNVALTKGKPRVRLGVIHPIESFWLAWGCDLQTGRERSRRERNFSEVTNWLIENQVDFDFISESILETADSRDAGGFSVGEMSYEAVLVPDCRTLRASTVDRLERFAQRGGRVIFMGSAPELVDAVRSDRAEKLAEKCVRIPFEFEALMTAVEPVRDVEIKNSFGGRSGRYMYRMREIGEDRILFIAQARDPMNKDIPRREDVTVEVVGTYSVRILDAFTGEICDGECTCSGGKTKIPARLYDHDSLLLYLTQEKDGYTGLSRGHKPKDYSETGRVSGTDSYELEEPNVLLLDRAEYSLDGAPFEKEEELLRADNICRSRIGYPTKPSCAMQPWLIKDEAGVPGHTLKLRFTFYADEPFEGVKIAAEPQKGMSMECNGEKVKMIPDGCFTDEAIKTYPLPKLSAGINVITVSMDYGLRTNVEWFYLLGDFGVRLCGRSAEMTCSPRAVGYSDLTQQNLPFYGANIRFYSTFEVDEDGEYGIKIPKFRCPLMTVSCDDGEEIPVALSPYIAEIGRLKKGKHTLCVRVFGNRYNSFGCLHCADEGRGWIDANCWRTSGDDFCYEYMVRRSGVLSAPVIMKK